MYLVSDLLENVPDLKLDVAVIPYDSFVPNSISTIELTLVSS